MLNLPINKFEEFKINTEKKAENDLKEFNKNHFNMLLDNRTNMLNTQHEAKKYIIDYENTNKTIWLKTRKELVLFL